MRILNLTQHAATADQIAAGVVEPADKVLVQALITFDELPDQIRLKAYAQTLAQMARQDGFDSVMIGGAPFFMPVLQAALQERGIKVLYAFSVRESRDEKLPDGSVKKTQVFRHAGFVEATQCRLLFSTHQSWCADAEERNYANHHPSPEAPQ